MDRAVVVPASRLFRTSRAAQRRATAASCAPRRVSRSGLPRIGLRGNSKTRTAAGEGSGDTALVSTTTSAAISSGRVRLISAAGCIPLAPGRNRSVNRTVMAGSAAIWIKVS